MTNDLQDFAARGWEVAARNVPCPTPGREQFTIITDWQGRTALWSHGTIWIRTEAAAQVVAAIAERIIKGLESMQ